MKIKFYTSPIFNLISFVIVMDTGLLTMLNIPFIKESSYQIMLTVACATVLWLNCFINKKINTALKPYSNYINLILFMWAIFIAIFVIYSYSKYGQGPVAIFNCFRYYLYFLLVLPIIYIFTKQNGYDSMVKVIILIVLVVLGLKMLHALVYNFTGITLFSTIEHYERYNRLRIGITPLFSIAYIYSFDRLINEKLIKNKVKWLVFVAFIITYELYVNMTRGYIIAIILTSVFMYLFKSRPKTNQVIIWLITFSVLLILYSSGYFEGFLQSFSESNEETGDSTLARQYAIEYFSQYTNDSPIFSMGFVCPTNDYFTAIYSSPSLNCHFDDLGISNMWFHYGALGVIITMITMGRILYLFIRICFLSNSKNKLLFVGFTVYIASTQISLSVLDGQRMLTFVIMWAMFEYEAKKIPRQKNRQVVKLTNRAKNLQMKDRIKISL